MTLNHQPTFIATKVERDFISIIGAGCSAPVACNATIEGENITLQTMIGYPNGTNIIEKTLTVNIDEYEALGQKMADLMIKDGVLDILRDAPNLAFKDTRPERM